MNYDNNLTKKIMGLRTLLLVVVIFYLSISIVNADSFRHIKLIVPFPNFILEEPQSFQLEINIKNEGDVDEYIDLMIIGHEDWKTSLKNGKYEINSVYIEKNQNILIDFEAQPNIIEKPGNYTFSIHAVSRDGYINTSLEINVEVLKPDTYKGILLSTPYPSIEGPAGNDYEISLIIVNKLGESRVIDFSSFYPKDWRVTFQPLYQDSYVRSLEFRADESRTIIATLSPPPNVEPGTYDITFLAESEDDNERVHFSFTIIGTYSLEMKTSDDLLSIDAQQGKDSVVTLLLRNTGSTALEDVHFSTNKPTGWDISFEPTDIPLLLSENVWEVRAIIKPSEDAIPGDYNVIITAAAEPYMTKDNINLRVTVHNSTILGFVGIGIMAILVIILILVYWRLGRR